MKVLITGSRNWTDREVIKYHLADLPADTTVIHGAARGADQLADSVARELGFEVIAVPADWTLHGRAAGPIRNQRMLEHNPDLVIAFPLRHGAYDEHRQARWDRGTRGNNMNDHNKYLFEYDYAGQASFSTSFPGAA